MWAVRQAMIMMMMFGGGKNLSGLAALLEAAKTLDKWFKLKEGPEQNPSLTNPGPGQVNNDSTNKNNIKYLHGIQMNLFVRIVLCECMCSNQIKTLPEALNFSDQSVRQDNATWTSGTNREQWEIYGWQNDRFSYMKMMIQYIWVCSQFRLAFYFASFPPPDTPSPQLTDCQFMFAYEIRQHSLLAMKVID